MACSAMPAMTSRRLFEVVEALVEFDAHQPNLPVM